MSANGRLPTWKETVECGNHALNRRDYGEALREYDKALKTTPRNVNLKISRAETLVCLRRFVDAFSEFGEAYTIDSTNHRLWHRMSLFHLRLGAIDMAESFMLGASEACREDLGVKIAKAKDRLVRGEKARKEDNWIAALREINNMIAEGVDSSLPIMTFKAEMLLRLDKLERAEETIKSAFELDTTLMHIRLSKFLGMPLEAYVWAVRAQIELAQGRGDIAVAEAEEARRIDHLNDEISAIHTHVRLVHTGNKHYDSGEYLTALKEYTVALKYAKPNVSMLMNLATCYWELDMLDNYFEISEQVLQIRPVNSNVLNL
ncbi:inactive TPR repeat-containing thioredoxin TTL3-like [Carex rostrata]